MSIIGLSEKLRLPRKGKIRLGEKKLSKKGREYPSTLDYFAVPEEVTEVYGEKPRKLDIMFPMENRDDFFPQWYKRYGRSKGLICKGDGKTATELPQGTGIMKDGKLVDEKGQPVDLNDFQMKEIDCEGKECPYYQERECKQVGNLQIILPKVKGLGIYQIDTSSYNSIININSGIKLIRGMLERVGINRISWIPLVLEVKMQEAHPVVKGKRILTIIPVMSVDLEMSVESMMAMLQRSALPAPTAEIDNPNLHDKPVLLFPKKDGSIPTDEGEKEAKEKAALEEKKKKEDKIASEKDKEVISSEFASKLLKECKEKGILPSQVEKMMKEQTALEEKKEREDKAAIDKIGETEVKDESKGKVSSEEEAQEDQDKQSEEGESEGKKGRNQLNIRWHVLKKKCLEIGVFADEGSYRDWIREEFGEGMGSSKDLNNKNMIWGIEVMAQKLKEHSKKGEE